MGTLANDCPGNPYADMMTQETHRPRPQVSIEDVPHQAVYVIRIASTTIIVPYRYLQHSMTHTVGEGSRSYMPGERPRLDSPGDSKYADQAQALYGMKPPAEKKPETKPQEKTDLCSTHIYTRK
jgi:hypothetical protein